MKTIESLKLRIIEQIININENNVNNSYFTLENDLSNLKKLLRD